MSSEPRESFWGTKEKWFDGCMYCLGLAIFFGLWSCVRNQPADSRPPEVQAADAAYLRGKSDGAGGRRLTEGQMNDLGWNRQQREHYRNGADWGKYESGK